MFGTLKSIWQLLLGIFLLMLGHGIQGSLVGIRGVAQDFSTIEISLVTSAYFFGFLIGSRLAPVMITQVGHIRVFAALASTISAVLIIYAIAPLAWVWIILRVLIGIGFSGVYVVAESWLNESATNSNRGQILAIYIIVQMLGLASAQSLLNFDEDTGYFLFVLASVLVSVSFMPILLSINPAPPYETSKPMKLAKLLEVSPLGVVGMVLLGTVFSALFGLSAVFGARVGLSIAENSLFIAMIYIGGIVSLYPIGYLSDLIDRRKLILLLSSTCALTALIGGLLGHLFIPLLVVAFVIGATTNPLYSLLIAYTNDYLDYEDMPACAGRMIFLNGFGAVSGPFLVGWTMDFFGDAGFFYFIAAIMLGLSTFNIIRMQLKKLPTDYESMSYAPISPSASPVVVEVAQEVAIEQHTEE
ncbi:MAG: MFS transporter [Rhodobacteraceae bacterium]|nr:MFS transporter [Paracoccaceae bacterium]